MVPLDEAQALVLESLAPLPPRSLSLAAALGCVTSEAVTAADPVPPFANSAMDGFAVRAADTARVPASLRVVGLLPAGSDPTGTEVGPGQAVRIMTGAPMPAGADSVVMVERTSGGERAGDTVVIAAPAAPGDHVRPAGEDVGAGEVALPAGTELGPAHLGVLASLGLALVDVHPRARVGVLSTGDELVAAGTPLAPGRIRDSNRPALLAAAARAGAVPVDLGCVPDDPAAIAASLETAGPCDALVVCGGVSVGDHDHTLDVLRRLCGQAHWLQVAIKPAKPLASARLGGVPVLGLPGNPASALVSFELFARPVLRRLMGHARAVPAPVAAVADHAFDRRADGKLHLVRVVAGVGDDARIHVRSAGGQGSNLLGSMAAANGLALVPDGGGLAAGGPVEVLLAAGPNLAW